MLIEMKVDSLTVDPFTNMPLLVLQGTEGEKLPLPIGVQDASSFATELQAIALDLPTTHDLMHTILGRSGMSVDRVEIHDIRGGRFRATLFLRLADGSCYGEECRPSDAIALAMRNKRPIFVAKKVITKANRSEPPSLALDAREMLAGLSETAFGKWKM